MLKKLAVLIAAGVILSSGAAAAPVFSKVDADGDGAVTREEFAAAYPDASDEQWELSDADGDGTMDVDEYAAAIEGGLLPVP